MIVLEEWSSQQLDWSLIHLIHSQSVAWKYSEFGCEEQTSYLTASYVHF